MPELGVGTARAEISDIGKVFLDTMAAANAVEIELSRIVASQALSPARSDAA